MWISLSGIAMAFFGLILIVLFILVLIATSVTLFVQKNKTQNTFKELKGYRFFLANIFTGLFLLLLLPILWQIKKFDSFLDHNMHWFITLIFTCYFLPFFCFFKL